MQQEQAQVPRADATDALRAPQAPQPWLRRALARIGLQRKLVFCFAFLLVLAMGISCWLFLGQSRGRINDIMSEQTRQMSYALALASKPAMEASNTDGLAQIGRDLLKARNILFVAFFDQHGQPLTLASRDPEFNNDELTFLHRNTQALTQVHARTSPVLGDYLAVMAPIVGQSPSQNGSRLLGYVAVGISQMREQQQLQSVNYLVMGIGCLLVVISLPIMYLMVHRIFQPIRQLVGATKRIAAGDLDARVAIHRPDVIGTLARSFNEMVIRVKEHRLALQQANAQLEQKVLDRTAELEDANRRLSSEIAEKEDFLRAVSHDLNAPLRNISGMASVLLMKHRQQFDDDIVHRLERIKKNVQAETDLISELLELSRIKTRRQKIESVDLMQLVHELGEVFESDLKSHNIEFIVDNPLPTFACERSRLRQVFQNLIDNAIKYMGDGPTRQIHIGCTQRPANIEFYVRDTGMGIESEDIGKIFYVFRRGKSQAVQNVAGKGVGLASVKSIIETYNGRIWVESQVGQGSTFRFTLSRALPQIGIAPAAPAPTAHNQCERGAA